MSCSLEAYIHQVNDLLGVLNVNMSLLLEYSELYVKQRHQDFRND